jgi:tetratricopeptide (TPR) repeat protein
VVLAASTGSPSKGLSHSTDLADDADLSHAEDLLARATVLINEDRLQEAAGLLDTGIGLLENQGESVRNLLADLLEGRARIENRIGRHGEALPLFERSLAAKAGIWGESHPETMGPLLGLASIENKKGGFSEAAVMYRGCLEILEEAYGPAHPQAVEAASGLSQSLSNLGDYAGAESVLRRGLEATVGASGERTAEAGELMLSLAEVLAMMGEHAESTRLYRRAAEIIEQVHGPDHSRYAAALSGLAHTKRRIGCLEEAEPLYREAIRIVEDRHGDSHPDLIHYRCRLGMTLHELQKRPRGLESIRHGIDIALRVYEEGSYQVAMEERHLGLVLWNLGRCEESREVLLRSLSVLEDYYGSEHPYLSKCLKGLARACVCLELFEEARRYIDRAVTLYEGVPGSDQSELAYLLTYKARIELYVRDWDSAVETQLRAAETAICELERMCEVSSMDEAITLAGKPKSAVSSLVSAAMAHPSLPDSTLSEVFSLLISSHGQVLNWLTERRRIIDPAADTVRVAQLWENVVTATKRVSDLVIRGSEGDREAYLEALAEARSEKEEAEWAFSAAGGRLRPAEWRDVGTRYFSPERVAGALERGSTLIHFVRFNRWLNSRSGDEASERSHYGAFRLKRGKDDSSPLDFVDLGCARSLEELVLAYRECVDGLEPGRRPSAREESEYRSIARELYERIWAPLTRADESPVPPAAVPVSGSLVLLIPDFWLQLLDFNTLLSPTGNPVIENWKVHYLSSAGDLFRTREPSNGTGLLAVGSPVCELRAPEMSEGEKRRESASHLALCDEAYRPRQPLPGAEQEIRAVARLFLAATGEPSHVLLDREATETAVKEHLPGRRVVHIATHGFFCDKGTGETKRYSARLANSMFMSGLILGPAKGSDDGFLTAYEVTGLDLREAEWVVLSACGSGLGQLFLWEGLLGLRRAFEIAVARTVVMALWRIDDMAVRDLMERIYDHRLAGHSTVDAIRLAQLERLLDQRRRFNRIHPALWGGIIAEGDWR